MKAKELIAYLDEYLRVSAITDYGPQGLQVEAHNEKVERVALSVDTAPDTINAAAEWGAACCWSITAYSGETWSQSQAR